MSEVEETPRSYSGALLATLAVALLAAVGGLIWCYTLGSRLGVQETALTESKEQNKKLASDLRETDARLRVATEELGNSLGLTQKQLDARAQELIQTLKLHPLPKESGYLGIIGVSAQRVIVDGRPLAVPIDLVVGHCPPPMTMQS